MTRRRQFFQELPRHGCFLIRTHTGTIHLVTRINGDTWERRPARGSSSQRSRYDRQAVPVRLFGQWSVGHHGDILVRDGSYLYGASTFHTAQITSIESTRPSLDVLRVTAVMKFSQSRFKWVRNFGDAFNRATYPLLHRHRY